MLKSKGVSVAKAAGEVKEKVKYGKQILTEIRLIFNQYYYNPTKPAKIQHRENVFIDDT